LLRKIEFGKDKAEIKLLDLAEQPVQKIRGVLFGVHDQDVGHKLWTNENWNRYLEDLALWGINTIFYTPFKFGQLNESGWHGTEEERATWRKRLEISKIAKSFGWNVGIKTTVNDVFLSQADKFKKAEKGLSQNIDVATESGNICLSAPEAWHAILSLKEELFKRLPYIDLLYVSATDPGGCACKKCRPYLKVYFDMCKDIASRLKKYHPNAKMIVGYNAVSKEGMEFCCKYLREERPSWIDYIVYGMYGTTFPFPEIQTKIPGQYKVLLLPDITMRDGWGTYGATPWVRHFNYSLGRSSDFFKLGGQFNPAAYTDMFDERLPVAYDFATMGVDVDGAFVYSEGLHDDITKTIWCQKGWNPCRNTMDILDEYCRWWYGKEAADEIKQAMLKMEEISDYRTKTDFFNPPKLIDFDNPEIIERVSAVSNLLEQAERKMRPCHLQSWRWKMLKLRAKMDALIAEAHTRRFTGESLNAGIVEKKRQIILLAREIFNLCKMTSILGRGHFSMDGVEKSLDKIIDDFA